MKKWLCLILALIMISAAFPALAEEPFKPGAEAPRCLVSDGERFYMVSDGTVYACGPDGVPEPFITGFPYDTSKAFDRPEYVNEMFVEGGKLYGFNDNSGDLYGYALEKGEAREISHVQADLAPITIEDGDYSYTSVRSLTAAWGKIWGQHENWMMDRSYLVSFDLSTGEAQVYKTENLSMLTPYREGTFLAFSYDRENAYDPDTGEYAPAAIGVFDPAADTFTELRKYPLRYNDVQQAVYSAAVDTLYLYTGNRVYQMAAMNDPELCAYSPFSWVNSGGLAVIGKVAGIIGETGFLTRTLDPSRLPNEKIVISGNMNTAAHNKAVAAMGEIPVLESTQSLYGDQLVQALITGDLEADVLCLDTSGYDLANILRKGYFAPLTDSGAVAGFVATLYPFLQEAGMENGVIYGVPALISTYGPVEGARGAFEETGLEKPESLTDVIGIFEKWGADKLYEDHPDYLPMEWMGGSYKEQLISMALDLWGHYLTAEKREWTLEDPILRQVLEKIEALDTSDWEVAVDWDNMSEEMEEFFERAALITPDMGYESLAGIASYGVMPLSLTDDTPPYTHVNVYVLLINARSKNKEAALRYIENYIQALEDTDLATMQKDWNEPITDPMNGKYVADVEEEIERLRKAMAGADAVDVPDLQQQLEGQQEYLARLKANPYRVSPEDLALWKQVMAYGFAERPSMFYTNLDPSSNLRTLRNQYTDGLISLDQFLSEGQRVIDLILKENQ